MSHVTVIPTLAFSSPSLLVTGSHIWRSTFRKESLNWIHCWRAQGITEDIVGSSEGSSVRSQKAEEECGCSVLLPFSTQPRTAMECCHSHSGAAFLLQIIYSSNYSQASQRLTSQKARHPAKLANNCNYHNSTLCLPYPNSFVFSHDQLCFIGSWTFQNVSQTLKVPILFTSSHTVQKSKYRVFFSEIQAICYLWVSITQKKCYPHPTCNSTDSILTFQKGRMTAHQGMIVPKRDPHLEKHEILQLHVGHLWFVMKLSGSQRA